MALKERSSVNDADLSACRVLWEFNCRSSRCADPDVILVMGSNDISVADFAATIAHEHVDAWVVCSGGVAHERDLLATTWHGSEAEAFSKRLVACGVAPNRILKETVSTNTAENIVLTKLLLERMNITVSAVQLVHKPFMTLRALLTAHQLWPGVAIGAVHESIDFNRYYARFGCQSLVHVLVGDTERIFRYPTLGYFAPVEIPPNVKTAFEHLVGRGFDGHRVPPEAAE